MSLVAVKVPENIGEKKVHFTVPEKVPVWGWLLRRLINFWIFR